MYTSDFLKNLIDIEWPSKKQEMEELWTVSGILKERYNKKFKFDLRPISKFKDNDFGKTASFNSKADKMVFDIEDQWIIIDMEEMHSFIKDKKIKDVNLIDLIQNLEWNVIILKK